MKLYHLDADYLIRFAELRHEGHELAVNNMREWLIIGPVMGTSAVAWREFCCGKTKPRPPLEVVNTRAMLKAGIVRYGAKQAEKAAELFNQTGRLKRLKRDCDIAATAIIAKAELATFNLDDFKRFVPFGLKIVGFSSFPIPPKQQSVSVTHKRIVA